MQNELPTWKPSDVYTGISKEDVLKLITKLGYKPIAFRKPTDSEAFFGNDLNIHFHNEQSFSQGGYRIIVEKL